MSLLFHLNHPGPFVLFAAETLTNTGTFCRMAGTPFCLHETSTSQDPGRSFHTLRSGAHTVSIPSNVQDKCSVYNTQQRPAQYLPKERQVSSSRETLSPRHLVEQESD